MDSIWKLKIHLEKQQLYLVISPIWAPMGAQTVKNLPVMQETWVQSLGGEDPLEEGMATRSSILVWEIHGQRSHGGLQSMMSQRVR